MVWSWYWCNQWTLSADSFRSHIREWSESLFRMPSFSFVFFLLSVILSHVTSYTSETLFKIFITSSTVLSRFLYLVESMPHTFWWKRFYCHISLCCTCILFLKSCFVAVHADHIRVVNHFNLTRIHHDLNYDSMYFISNT